MKAIIYARVSTTRQAEDGISIEAQIEQCKRKAADLGAVVVQIFTDDGVSGTDAVRRHAFQRAINFCAYNEVDYFLVWSTSRFARNKIDAASYKEILKKSNTKVIYASMSIDNSTDEGWFTESLLEIMDEHYSRQLSRDVKRSMMKNAEEGFFNGGRIPFGYKAEMIGKRRKLIPDEVESKLMRQIFKRFSNGESALSICRDLNNSGFTYRGAEFQAASLSRLLKNKVYIGITIFNKTTRRKENPESEWIIKQTHEPIIDQKTFDKVQRRFSPRTIYPGSPKSNFFFTGILRCGSCKSGLVIETATGKSKKIYNYYNCAKFRKGYKCKSRRIPAEKFDEYMLGIVLEKLLNHDMVKAFLTEMYKVHQEKNSERKERLMLIKTELADVRRKRESLITALEKSNIQAESIIQRIALYDEKEKNLLVENEKTSAEPIYTEPSNVELEVAIKTLKEIIGDVRNVKKTRILLMSFIEYIEVLENNIVINYLPERIINYKDVHSKNGWCAYRDSNPGYCLESAVSSATRR